MTDKLDNLPAPNGKIATHGPGVDGKKKTPHVSKAATIVERVRGVWAVVEMVAEEAILAAEALTDKKGPAKKAYVVETVTRYLKDAEGKYDVLPAPIEGMAFAGIRWGLDYIVERVFRRLNASGLVNAR